MIALACLAATAGRVYAEGEGPFLNTDIGASFITGLPSGVSVNPGVRFSLVPGYRIYNDELTILGSMAVLHSFGPALEDFEIR